MICVLSNTLYEYFDNRKHDWDNDIPRYINIGMPISLRPPAKTLKDVRMVNDFVSYPVTLPIRKELKDVLPQMQKYFKEIRTSLGPFGALYAFLMLVNHPFTMPKYLLDFVSNKYHMLFTNLNASKTPYVWDGK